MCTSFLRRQENGLFDNKMQQDAQEMLHFLLNRLQTAAQLELVTTPTKVISDSPPLCKRAAGDHSAITLGKDTTPSPLSATTNTGSTSRKRFISREGNKVRKRLRSSAGKQTVSLTDYYTIAGTSTKTHLTSTTKAVKNSGKTDQRVGKEPMGRKNLQFITSMFQGELISQIHCYECDNLTRRAEPFLGVSVPVSSQSLPGFLQSCAPVKEEPKAGTGFCRNKNSSKGLVGPFSLSWALSQFCYREKLSGNNKYNCEECVHLVEAEKTLLFGHLPLVMTIHLNRFATHTSHGVLAGVSVSKIRGNIAVPTSLCFSTWCTPDCHNRNKMYHLFAVVFHTGSSCSSGHYTACVRGRECIDLLPPFVDGKVIHEKGSWFYFDDEVVEILTTEELLNMLSPLTPSALTAYILFYTINR